MQTPLRMEVHKNYLACFALTAVVMLLWYHCYAIDHTAGFCSKHFFNPRRNQPHCFRFGFKSTIKPSSNNVWVKTLFTDAYTRFLARFKDKASSLCPEGRLAC